MTYKTIEVSEEAYRVLNSLKKENETFTDVILRISKKNRSIAQLLEWLNQEKDFDDLADSIEQVYNERNKVILRY